MPRIQARFGARRRVARGLLVALALGGCAGARPPTCAEVPISSGAARLSYDDLRRGQCWVTPPSEVILAETARWAARLIEQADRDQRARVAWKGAEEQGQKGALAEAEATLETVDRESAVLLREAFTTLGWPSKACVGEEAFRATWLLLQHADEDPDLQILGALLLEATEGLSRRDLSHVAMLKDRVLVNAGSAQIYGSQGKCDEDGVWRPRPIVEAAGVDERRARYGLEPLASYVDFMQRFCR